MLGSDAKMRVTRAHVRQALKRRKAVREANERHNQCPFLQASPARLSQTRHRALPSLHHHLCHNLLLQHRHVNMCCNMWIYQAASNSANYAKQSGARAQAPQTLLIISKASTNKFINNVLAQMRRSNQPFTPLSTTRKCFRRLMTSLTCSFIILRCLYRCRTASISETF